jgi:hypothetical protein
VLYCVIVLLCPWSLKIRAHRTNDLDYARTQKALASCQFCFGEDDSPPKAPVVAMGTRVYLSSTLNEELVPGHCLIVPIQHHLTMLEGDDDVWDEVRVRPPTSFFLDLYLANMSCHRGDSEI